MTLSYGTPRHAKIALDELATQMRYRRGLRNLAYIQLHRRWLKNPERELIEIDGAYRLEGEPRRRETNELKYKRYSWTTVKKLIDMNHVTVHECDENGRPLRLTCWYPGWSYDQPVNA